MSRGRSRAGSPAVAVAFDAAASAATASTAKDTTEQQDDEDTECIICFEALESRGGPVQLPCSCRVVYCHLCWDRALAASMSATGQALCPSCRCPMYVDFDPQKGHLCFSRAPVSPGGEVAADNWRKRLYKQARPRQIELLQQYGAQGTGGTATSASDVAGPAGGGGGTGDPSIGHEGAVPGDSGQVEAPAAVQEAPRCVCGCRLRCVSVRDRVLAFVSEETPYPPPRSVVERLMLRPPVNCDICERSVDQGSRVWTCENGRRTVLHAVAYDVCEACFAYHAHGVELPVTTRGDEDEDDEEEDDDSRESMDDDSEFSDRS